MTPVFSARRRADEFDSLIQGSPGTDFDDARYAEFLEIVSALRATAPAPARPEFVSSLRERLMLAAQTELVPAEEARLTIPTRRPRDRRIAAAIGGFAIVGATTSMAMAAQSALPGDVLYPLKRAIENLQTGVSVDEGQKGATMLANASGRLDEVSALSREGRLEDTTVIAETLNTFTEQATGASDLLLSDYEATGDESSIIELRDFTASSMDTLASLEALVPADAHDELLHAARVLTQIDAEAEQACPDCGGVGITDIPKILAGNATFGGSGTSVTPTATDGKGKKTDKTGATEPGPGDGDTLNTGGVLTSTSDGDSGGTDGGDGTTDSDPISKLTDGLVDGGSGSTGTSTSGIPGVPLTDEVDGTVDDLEGTTDDLIDPTP